MSLAPKEIVLDGVVVATGPRGRHKATHCKRGHALIEDNLYRDPNGARRCQMCRLLLSRGRPQYVQDRLDSLSL